MPVSKFRFTMDSDCESTSSAASTATTEMSIRVKRAEDIRQRTVIITMDSKGKPYNRFDMATALVKVISLSEVSTFGPLTRNCEWYLTVATNETKIKLLQAGSLTVLGRFQGTIRPANESEVRVRIHWLPPWVDNKSIADSFIRHGFEITSVSVDKSTVHLNNTETLTNSHITVRTAIIRLKDNMPVPHLINIHDVVFNKIHEALITIPGRSPLCLKCRYTGHYRNECATPYCNLCKQYGHKPISCVNRYAAAAAKSTENAPVMEADVASDFDSVTHTVAPDFDSLTHAVASDFSSVPGTDSLNLNMTETPVSTEPSSVKQIVDVESASVVVVLPAAEHAQSDAQIIPDSMPEKSPFGTSFDVSSSGPWLTQRGRKRGGSSPSPSRSSSQSRPPSKGPKHRAKVNLSSVDIDCLNQASPGDIADPFL